MAVELKRPLFLLLLLLLLLLSPAYEVDPEESMSYSTLEIRSLSHFVHPDTMKTLWLLLSF